MIKQAKIHQLPNGNWRVLSRTGKNLGTYPTKSEAQARLAQVEMFKHMKSKKTASQDELATEPVTFSGVMRQLRLHHPEWVVPFLKEFKTAFEAATAEHLEDAEAVALMEVIHHVSHNS